MEKISKNFYKGKEITDLKEIYQISLIRGSIIVSNNYVNWIKPASFILHWPLSVILLYRYYYSIKDNGLNF
jgi:hypothetical protein